MIKEFLLFSFAVSFFIEGKRQPGVIPEEQRLYNDLMRYYENDVRPVQNATKVISINFRLTLNQIVDLDERLQVLTTNVFIDQEWDDENLRWNVDEYNGIKNLRVAAAAVWLPDTFIFNNADDGSTGFMRGVYVLINYKGRVKWPVPMKLRSSCKVDITYFPFDYQICTMRFGSWIYSGDWVDFNSSLQALDLKNYMDNSEWELLSISFEKQMRHYACCSEAHPDLLFTLFIKRRTFYYIWNIIVPCVMLSILTLLTFWLPSTSGEKISLGLSVFLAFSMFMLLIAEEVPATSQSVPLIGIYLTTVMTMTSVSVIMAVLVINLYNKGAKAKRAPKWLKVVVLNWICRFLRMTHDIERIAQSIRLKEEEEEKYRCEKHTGKTNNSNRRPSAARLDTTLSGNLENLGFESDTTPSDPNKDKLSRRFSTISNQDVRPEEEQIWLKREDLLKEESKNLMPPPLSGPSSNSKKSTSLAGLGLPGLGMSKSAPQVKGTDTIAKLVVAICRKEQALVSRKEMIVEWQIIATVIDRLLFWIFLMATVLSYVIVLLVIPYVSKGYTKAFKDKGPSYVLME